MHKRNSILFRKSNSRHVSFVLYEYLKNDVVFVYFCSIDSSTIYLSQAYELSLPTLSNITWIKLDSFQHFPGEIVEKRQVLNNHQQLVQPLSRNADLQWHVMKMPCPKDHWTQWKGEWTCMMHGCFWVRPK